MQNRCDTVGRWESGGIFTCTRGDAGECTYLSCDAWVSQEQLGDYGHFSDSGDFRLQGNLFTDLIPEIDIIPRQQQVSMRRNFVIEVIIADRCLSLPSNRAFNSSLASLSPRLTNEYIVTRVVQCPRYFITASQVPQGMACAHTSCLVSDGWIR